MGLAFVVIYEHCHIRNSDRAVISTGDRVAQCRLVGRAVVVLRRIHREHYRLADNIGAVVDGLHGWRNGDVVVAGLADSDRHIARWYVGQ